MTEDWFDDLLDRHPGEPVPEGFAQRLRERIDLEEGTRRRHRGILRPAFASWLGRAAAGILLLAAGFWLGRGAPEVTLDPIQTEQEPVTAEGTPVDAELLADLYQNQDLLEAWDLVVDEELELALRDTTAGTWDLAPGESDG